MSDPTDTSYAMTNATADRKPRIACLVSYWAATRSHADWIITKLLDGYWWQGAHTPSRVEVVSVYIHQLDSSQLGQKVCKSKNIPIYKSVSEALTLGRNELAVDGVVIIGEHGDYPVNQKGQWLLPRWWIFQQVISVFEKSGRSVPVFNDKHLSYDWHEAKWIFDKSRELHFPLMGGSSVPFHYRRPETELETGTPVKESLILGDAPDEGAFFHCVDLLQAFIERRKGGETGVRSVQSIRGPETRNWVRRHPWAANLMETVRLHHRLNTGHFEGIRIPNVCVINCRDGTKAAILNARNVGWTFAAAIQGFEEPSIITLDDDPGPFSQYHAFNGQPHWITEMMVTKKEPFHAERLLISTGITSFNIESNWDNGAFSAIGQTIETNALAVNYRPTRGIQFNKGAPPPKIPYIRGFDT